MQASKQPGADGPLGPLRRYHRTRTESGAKPAVVRLLAKSIQRCGLSYDPYEQLAGYIHRRATSGQTKGQKPCMTVNLVKVCLGVSAASPLVKPHVLHSRVRAETQAHGTCRDKKLAKLHAFQPSLLQKSASADENSDAVARLQHMALWQLSNSASIEAMPCGDVVGWFAAHMAKAVASHCHLAVAVQGVPIHVRTSRPAVLSFPA